MSLISLSSSSTPRKTAFHSKLSEIEKFLNQLRGIRRVWQFSGLLLLFSVYSYRVRELLVFWLFFSLLFVLLAGAGDSRRRTRLLRGEIRDSLDEHDSVNHSGARARFC